MFTGVVSRMEDNAADGHRPSLPRQYWGRPLSRRGRPDKDTTGLPLINTNDGTWAHEYVTGRSIPIRYTTPSSKGIS